MSDWLVDTHALLWFWSDASRLSDAATQVMEDGDAQLVVSAASLWEIAIKTSLGKLRVPDVYPALLDEDGFRCLPVLPAHAHAVRALPIEEHRNPFDRMLVAQAKVEMLPIISADERLDRYAVARLW